MLDVRSSGRRRRSWLPRVLLLSTLSAIACSSASPEQQALINFFRAAALRDNTTLANVAVLSFDPRRDGSVQQFAIVSMGPEKRHPLQPRPSGEHTMAIISLTAPGRPDVDVSGMNVDIITRQVTIDAQVRTPEGATAHRTLVVTLQRGVARQLNQTVDGRWIITGLQPQPGSAKQT